LPTGTTVELGAELRYYDERAMAEILHLYISPSHNYFGHHGQAPGEAPTEEVVQLECVAERGIKGDRFFDFKEDYKGQITFFAQEVYEDLCRVLDTHDKSPAVFRRNVITSGVDLPAWYDAEFTVQGVRFRGTGECKPCYWMDRAFAPGAEDALQGRGGVRAAILTDGVLHRGPIS